MASCRGRGIGVRRQPIAIMGKLCILSFYCNHMFSLTLLCLLVPYVYDLWCFNIFANWRNSANCKCEHLCFNRSYRFYNLVMSEFLSESSSVISNFSNSVDLISYAVCQIAFYIWAQSNYNDRWKSSARLSRDRDKHHLCIRRRSHTLTYLSLQPKDQRKPT